MSYAAPVDNGRALFDGIKGEVQAYYTSRAGIIADIDKYLLTPVNHALTLADVIESSAYKELHDRTSPGMCIDLLAFNTDYGYTILLPRPPKHGVLLHSAREGIQPKQPVLESIYSAVLGELANSEGTITERNLDEYINTIEFDMRNVAPGERRPLQSIISAINEQQPDLLQRLNISMRIVPFNELQSLFLGIASKTPAQPVYQPIARVESAVQPKSYSVREISDCLEFDPKSKSGYHLIEGLTRGSDIIVPRNRRETLKVTLAGIKKIQSKLPKEQAKKLEALINARK